VVPKQLVEFIPRKQPGESAGLSWAVKKLLAEIVEDKIAGGERRQYFG